MRFWSCTLVVLLSISTLASADLKIKTRTTVMGHTTESTVYIKGARMRTETSFGGRASAVSIMQCDQKRIVTIAGNQCMLMAMGGSGESACPATPSMGSMMKGAFGGQPEAPKKGGVLTITRNSTDTGERQDMFGFKARHIKTTMAMESSPDACNQSHMKMEIDGWYADVSAGFNCGDESYKAMACSGGGKRGCMDRIVMKGSGGGAMGYPLKQTMTTVSEQGTFTMTTEVIELTNAAADASLFDAPAGCQTMDLTSMMGKSEAPAAAEPSPTPTPAAAAPTPAPPPALAPKAAGVLRIGVVKINDKTGQGLPTENLVANLMSELSRNQMEPVLLTADSPQADVESEARDKQCDYIVYTVPMQVVEPNGGGIPAASLPKGVKLDPAKYQALSDITLYKVGKAQPEIKDLALAANGDRFGVDAVMGTFVIESDKVAAQISEDAHPTAAKSKTAASKTKSK